MNDPLKIDNPASAKRGNDRDSLLLKAILRFPASKNEGEVRIRNLSAGGLMAETPARVMRGEVVEVHLRSIGWITGHVVWITEGRIGIAFDHPINPKDARKPVGTSTLELPTYLKKLNVTADPSKIRRT
jgi:PilZ domain